MRRDWTGLPANIVPIISEKACSTNLQYINLWMVCKEWWRALNPYPQHLCKGAWLLLPRASKDSELIFYNIFTSQTHWFQAPYISGKYLCGSSYGWLALEHDHRVSLFNPITRISLDLPSLYPTILKVPTSEGQRSGRSNQHEPYTPCMFKVIVSCSPSQMDCIVVAWFLPSSYWELGFCRIGDDCWTGLKMREGWRLGLLDFTYHNNMVYTVNRRKEVSVYDLHDLSVRKFSSKIYTISSLDSINLVEGSAVSGEPLVVRSTEFPGNNTKKTIAVYKWFDNIKKWRQVRNIGKRVIFLNRWCTVSLHSINLQAEEERDRRPQENNNIYYNIRHSWTSSYFSRIGVNRVNLESREDVLHNPGPTEVFPLLSSSPMWFIPRVI